MNLENVNKAIAVMERVKERGDKLDMRNWQTGEVAVTEEVAHERGTSACFAGWIAVSPEFQADGGEVEFNGVPIYAGLYGDRAIQQWLGIPFKEAADMCGLSNTGRVYDERYADEVTVDDVLAALYRLRDTGSAYPKESVQ